MTYVVLSYIGALAKVSLIDREGNELDYYQTPGYLLHYHNAVHSMPMLARFDFWLDNIDSQMAIPVGAYLGDPPKREKTPAELEKLAAQKLALQALGVMDVDDTEMFKEIKPRTKLKDLLEKMDQKRIVQITLIQHAETSQLGRGPVGEVIKNAYTSDLYVWRTVQRGDHLELFCAYEQQI